MEEKHTTEAADKTAPVSDMTDVFNNLVEGVDQLATLIADASDGAEGDEFARMVDASSKKDEGNN